MPLNQDTPNWVDPTNDWPEYSWLTEEMCRRAFVACSKEKVVPYGCYVKVDDFTMRFETQEYLDKVMNHLLDAPPETAAEVTYRCAGYEANAHIMPVPTQIRLHQMLNNAVAAKHLLWDTEREIEVLLTGSDDGELSNNASDAVSNSITWLAAAQLHVSEVAPEDFGQIVSMIAPLLKE